MILIYKNRTDEDIWPIWVPAINLPFYLPHLASKTACHVADTATPSLVENPLPFLGHGHQIAGKNVCTIHVNREAHKRR
jgi:hypothetical protein